MPWSPVRLSCICRQMMARLAPLLLLSCAQPDPVSFCQRHGALVYGDTANCDRVALAIEGAEAGARMLYRDRGDSAVRALRGHVRIHADDVDLFGEATGYSYNRVVHYATRNDCAEKVIGHELAHVIGQQLGEPDYAGHENQFLFGSFSVAAFGAGAVRADCDGL